MTRRLCYAIGALVAAAMVVLCLQPAAAAAQPVDLSTFTTVARFEPSGPLSYPTVASATREVQGRLA